MNEVFYRALRDIISPLRDRIMSIVARGVVEKVSDEKNIQTIKAQILAGEVRDEMERFQEYGFTSKPFSDSECVIVFAGGNRDHGLVIATDDRKYRLKNLQDGEVAIYTDEGDSITLKRNREIEIKGDSKVVVKSDNIELGKENLEKIVMGETFQEFFNNHQHIGNLGVPTDIPVVQMSDAQLSSVVKAGT